MSAARTREPRLSWQTQQRVFAGFLLTPALVLIVATLGVPILTGIVTSLQRIRINMPQRNSNFVGLENYRRMLESPDFWHSLKVSVIYTTGSVALTFALGFGAALLLSRQSRFNPIARALTLLPWATPVVAGTLTWGVMLDYDSGIINQMLAWLPGNIPAVPWLIEARTSMWAVILVDAWHTFPLAMLLLLAGLQGIPGELYEFGFDRRGQRLAEVPPHHLAIPGPDQQRRAAPARGLGLPPLRRRLPPDPRRPRRRHHDADHADI